MKISTKDSINRDLQETPKNTESQKLALDTLIKEKDQNLVSKNHELEEKCQEIIDVQEKKSLQDSEATKKSLESEAERIRTKLQEESETEKELIIQNDKLEQTVDNLKKKCATVSR